MSTTRFGSRHNRSYRPRLEALEERLPPGDALLAGLLAHALAAADPVDGTLAGTGSDPWSGRAGTPFADAAHFDFEPRILPPLGMTATAGGSREARADRTPDPIAQGLSSPFGEASAGHRPAPAGSVLAAPAVAPADRGGPAFAATVPITAPWIVATAPVGSTAAAADWSILLAMRSEGPGSATPAGVAATVHARFDLSAPTGGAFPSDRFTVADASHLTGRRVDLPPPDCRVYVSDCADLVALNALDGFSLQPRLSIPFDGPIDVTTVSGATVVLLRLGSTVPGEAGDIAAVGINQIVWDPATTTLHVESDELLEQHTRYALLVTRGVRAEGGAPVEASPAFRSFLAGPALEPALEGYRTALREALAVVASLGVPESEIATASVFTTQSITAVLEKIRDQIHTATPAPADFLLGPGRTRTVFPLDDVLGLKWNQQTRVDPPAFTPVGLDVGLLRLIPGAVGRVAFGKYRSPDFEVHPGEYLPPVGTRTGMPTATGVSDIYFNLFLPSGPAPAGGWPVVIAGHGGTISKNVFPLSAAAMLASHGLATIAINAFGLGYGPLGTLHVRQRSGTVMAFSSGGRGIDQNGDRVIGVAEGSQAVGTQAFITNRDWHRQTVADLMQLVRVIQVGADVDGDTTPDLDPSRIYYYGQSQGGNYGTMFLAVEPDVRAGVPNVPVASIMEGRRLDPANRAGVGSVLAARVPSLINPPGLTSIGGVPVAAPHFNENLPLRDRPPVINDVPGAMAIQQLFDRREWAMQSGDSLAYAPHLRRAPLPGVSAKPVLIQFARGDQSIPLPTTLALLRAGGLADRATYYRHDLAFAEDARLPRSPHSVIHAVSSTIPLWAASSRGLQEQIAVFLASDGETVIHPEPARFFEVPVAGPLPEGLDYIV